MPCHNLQAGLAIDLIGFDSIRSRAAEGGQSKVRNKALDSRCIGCKRQELSCKKHTQATQPPRFETRRWGGFALRWRCCLFRLVNWKGLARFAKSERGGLVCFYPLLMASHKGDAACAISWHAAATGDIQRRRRRRRHHEREARSAIGSRCVQTVGRFATWRC
jgi:hypothetical protein